MDAAPTRELFVGNLPETITLNNLKYCFSKYGDVESCILYRFLTKNQEIWRISYHCYYAIVTFGTAEGVMMAMKDGHRNQISIRNKNLKVMPAIFWYQLNCLEDQKDFLRKIEIHDKKNMDYQYTQEYLQNDSKKVSIHILNDDCLRQIFELLPILDRIRIEKVCKRWKVVSLESWHTVRVLDFSFPKQGSVNIRRISVLLYSTRTLHKLLLRCGRFLTQLNLFISPFESLSEDILITVEQLCPNLTNVNINFEEVNRVPVSVIDAVKKICKNITRLTIRHSRSSYESNNVLSDFFSTLKNLEYFGINTCMMSYKCLTSMSVVETLHRITLSERCCIFDRYAFESISHYCINLKVLNINRDTHDAINSLKFSNLVKLENIKITSNDFVTDDYVTNMVLNCRELVDVNIEGCWKVTDAGLMSIATLPKLERLNISDIRSITDQGLRHIRDLKVLECRKCKCTEESLSMVLRSSPQLRLLDISGCSLFNKESFLEIANEICNRHTRNILLEKITKGLFDRIFSNINNLQTVEILASPYFQILVNGK